jgi:hypothetical protein
MPTPLHAALAAQKNILRLGDRTRGYLQALVTGFKLTKVMPGCLLELAISDDAFSLIDRHGKQDFLNVLATVGDKPRDCLRAKLDAFFDDPGQEAYRFDCSEWPLRFANGGVLPIVHLEGDDYFCCFYRDVNPIGWNIANGASDTTEELLDPGRVVSREFGEELLIYSQQERVIYAHDPGQDNRPPGYQRNALQAWATLLNNPNLPNYAVRPLPLKWIEGPDRLRVTLGTRVVASKGYFLSVTPDDNAIEVDRFALIQLEGKDPRLMDGEITDGVLLNRIVGLFRVDRLQGVLEGREFVPDVHFYAGERKDPEEWAASLVRNRTAIEELKAAGKRSDVQLGAYDREPHKFNLCPITRSVVGRYYRWRIAEHTTNEPPEPCRPMDGCQVFISYRSMVSDVATRVYQSLRDAGISAFCSVNSLEALGESDYFAAIVRALGQAKVMVVIGDRAEDFSTGWVDFEWKSFMGEILSARKPGAELYVLSIDVPVGDLPYALRSREVIPCHRPAPGEAIERLHRFIRPVLQRK